MTGEGSLFDIPPAAIGRFRVLHQVGAGTCGPVFRATDPDLDRAVAIKLFTLNLTPERAAALVGRLEHLVARTPPLAGVVSPVAAGLHGQTPFLATTFASGDSLDVALRQFGPAALEDLVPRLRALAAALDAAAERGILHGALHPRDVLVSEHDTAITGLGVWPLLGEVGVRLPARRPYRAPELTDAAVSAAGDQFSLAALAYEWMTGRRAPTLFGLSDMAPLPGADRDRMALVFARALHASPDHRYASCAEFVSAVADVAADAESPAPPVETRGRRRPRPAVPTLPLDVFPAESAADDLPLSPVSDGLVPVESDEAGEGGEPEEEADAWVPPLRDDDADAGDVVMPEASSLAGIEAEPERDEPPMRHVEAPSFGGIGLQPAASSTGTGRLAVAALLGLVLGMGVGYAIWGRTTGAGITAPAANAVEDLTAQPNTLPTTTPAAQPGPVEGRGPADDRLAPPGSRASIEPSEPAPPAPTTPVAPETPAAVAPAAAAPPAARASPPAPAAPSGSLLIRSTPAGATVFVDDERKGVTPLALRDLALGTRRVRVQRDGFDVENRQVTLTRGRPSRSVDVRLRRPAAATSTTAPATPAPATSGAKTGTLLIESRPSGATALVNGRSVGATPVTIEDLAPGSYSVQLQLAGFRPFTTTVRVVAGARARAAASLTGAQEPK